MERGNPNTCSREEASREGERENHSRGARAPNLLNIALCGLASPCWHPFPFCLRLGGRALTPRKERNKGDQESMHRTY